MCQATKFRECISCAVSVSGQQSASLSGIIDSIRGSYPLATLRTPCTYVLSSGGNEENEKRGRRRKTQFLIPRLSISPLQICRLELLLAGGLGGGALIPAAAAAALGPVGLAAVDADEDQEEEGEDGPDRHGDHGLLRNVI